MTKFKTSELCANTLIYEKDFIIATFQTKSKFNFQIDDTIDMSFSRTGFNPESGFIYVVNEIIEERESLKGWFFVKLKLTKFVE